MPGWGGGSCYSWSLQPESEGAESGETADAVTVWKRAGDVDSLKAFPVQSQTGNALLRGWAPMSEKPAFLGPLAPKPRQS